MAVRGAHGARRAALAAAMTAATAAILLGAAIAAPAGDGAAPAPNGGTGGSHHAHHGGNPASPYRGATGCGSGTSPARAAATCRDRAQGARARDRHRLHQGWRRRRLLEPVHARAGQPPARAAASRSAPGSSSTATIPAPRRSAARRRCAKGADCLVIDAEVELRGQLRRRRHATSTRCARRIGADFPIALAGFPYVDYHPAFPYSVFLGPGGAHSTCRRSTGRRSAPRSRGGLRAHLPLQPRLRAADLPARPDLRQPAGRRQIQRFRRSGDRLRPRRRRAGGHGRRRTVASGGRSAARPPGASRRATGRSALPPLSQGSRGDLVVWAQEHLRGAGESVPVTGYFGHKTRRAVKRFQRVNDFIDDGHIGAKTWHALLAVAPKTVNWSGRGSRHLATRSAGPDAPALGLAARGARRDPARVRALGRRASASRPSSLRARSGRPARGHPRWGCGSSPASTSWCAPGGRRSGPARLTTRSCSAQAIFTGTRTSP